MAFELQDLPYSYDALSPYISAETLEYHHDKHHNAYATKCAELAQAAGLADKTLEQLILISSKDASGQALFNNAAQHWNHQNFWKWMKAGGGGNGGKAISGKLLSLINDTFGSYDEFRGKFIDAGMTQFGSGWAWLVLDENGKLEIVKTSNAGNPLVDGKTPILSCDVWEHSYYIDYRNARLKYLETFMDNLANWDYAAQLFESGPVKIAA